MLRTADLPCPTATSLACSIHWPADDIHPSSVPRHVDRVPEEPAEEKPSEPGDGDSCLHSVPASMRRLPLWRHSDFGFRPAATGFTFGRSEAEPTTLDSDTPDAAGYNVSRPRLEHQPRLDLSSSTLLLTIGVAPKVRAERGTTTATSSWSSATTSPSRRHDQAAGQDT